jgi:hypothetical protein
MHVTLEVVDGPATGARVIVNRGQIASVGRTEWSDFSLPGDAELADVHFEVAFSASGCRLRSLGSAVTLVNGASVTETMLRTGDKITAGQSVFAIQFLGESFLQSTPQETAESQPAESDDAGEGTPAGPAEPVKAAVLCKELDISDDGKEWLQEDDTPEGYFNKLLAAELFVDGLRFLARWLPKPVAVRWACDCVREQLGDAMTPAEARAVEAAEQWVDDGSEENRRAAQAAAQETEFGGPASWTALAAFWSGGSLAPPDLPEAPASDELTSKAVVGGLMIAAGLGEAPDVDQRHRDFLERGKTLAAEEGLITVQS